MSRLAFAVLALTVLVGLFGPVPIRPHMDPHGLQVGSWLAPSDMMEVAIGPHFEPNGFFCLSRYRAQGMDELASYRSHLA